MTWLRYTLEPLTVVSAGRSREVGFDRPAYDVLPGTVIRGALGAGWWQEGAGDQERFDAVFGSLMTVHAAVPTLGDEAAQLIPMLWSREKYGNQEYVAAAATSANGRVAGRGWSVPREWMTASTRTSLEKGVAVDGVLFTRRASSKGVVYGGHIRLDGDSDATVAWLTKGRNVSVGGQRSVLGRCRWQCEVAEDPFPAPKEAGTVMLVALQPIILLDELGAASLDLQGAIATAVAAAGASVEVGEVRTRPVSVGGWHGRAGIPKPMDWALDAGSSALLKATDPAAWQALHGGLGIRRLEGYGAVALVAPGARPEVGPVVIRQSVPATEPAPQLEPAPQAEVPPVSPPPAQVLAQSTVDLVALVDRVAAADRARVVGNLLDLAHDLERMETSPMQRMRITGKLGEAAKAAWLDNVPPDVADGLLSALKRSSDRRQAIAQLEGVR